MLTIVQTTSLRNFLALVLLLVLLSSTFLTPATVSAKAGDVITIGRVTVKPATGLRGTWVIGGKTFVAKATTQFDQADGPLVVGACAKVKVRSGAVKEIDSEPAANCR